MIDSSALATFRQKSRAFLALPMCDDCWAPATHFSDETERKRCDECHAEHCEIMRIKCGACGKPTVWDDTYEDLCYRCIRAENE